MKVPSLAKKAFAAMAIATGIGGCVSYEETTRYRAQPAYGYNTTYQNNAQRYVNCNTQRAGYYGYRTVCYDRATGRNVYMN